MSHPVSDFLRERLHNRAFVTTGTPHGVSGADTVFRYQVEDEAGGHVIARAMGPDTIETLYHLLTTDGELLSGWSRSHVGVDASGRTTLSFAWGWLSGAEGGGQSHYIERVAP